MAFGCNVPADCKHFLNNLSPLARCQDPEHNGGAKCSRGAERSGGAKCGGVWGKAERGKAGLVVAVGLSTVD